MQELLNVTFADGKLPDGWVHAQRTFTFENGALHGNWGGHVNLLVPGERWEAVRLEVDVEGGLVLFGDNTLSVVVNLDGGRHRVACYGKATLAESDAPAASGDGVRRVVIEFNRGRLSGAVDGEEVIAYDDRHPALTGGCMDLGFWDDCVVHRVRILAEGPGPAPVAPGPRPSGDDFHLEVNVDFFDDLIRAPFTPKMFDDLFREFREWGVKRCHWIYYGGTGKGWWRYCPMNVDVNAARTVEASGEIFPAAVAAGHANGVEVYGMVKPFDMGFWHTMPERSRAAEERGKLRRLGGPVGWVADFIVERRDLLMARKPGAFGPGGSGPITRIDFVKEDGREAGFTVEDLRLYVSDDNGAYRPYEGPVTREETIEDYPVWEHTASGGRPTGQSRRARVMRLKELRIEEPFFAVAVEGRSRSFGNSLINLVHIFGEQGEERMITYGVKPRRDTSESETAREIGDFRKVGVEFDAVPGTPTAVFPCFDAIRARHWLDGGDGVLAFARGKEQHPLAALSPSFADSRAWWLSWLRDCLDAGADGLELRFRNHHSPFAWGEFGFEPPVRDAFLERHGVDLWETDDFDREALRRLRGEAYTEFYREAKDLAREYGKPLGLHISQTMCMEPDEGAAMELRMDWRRWLEDGLADSVTMKEVWPRTRFGDEVLAHTRRRGVPVIFCPYGNNTWGKEGGEQVVEARIRQAREGGYDGFQYYECASVIHAKPEGEIVMTQPALREVFRKRFAR